MEKRRISPPRNPAAPPPYTAARSPPPAYSPGHSRQVRAEPLLAALTVSTLLLLSLCLVLAWQHRLLLAAIRTNNSTDTGGTDQ